MPEDRNLPIRRPSEQVIGNFGEDTPLGHETLAWYSGSCGVFKFFQNGKHFVFTEKGQDDRPYFGVHDQGVKLIRPASAEEQELTLTRMKTSQIEFPNGNLLRLIRTAETTLPPEDKPDPRLQEARKANRQTRPLSHSPSSLSQD